MTSKKRYEHAKAKVVLHRTLGKLHGDKKVFNGMKYCCGLRKYKSDAAFHFCALDSVNSTQPANVPNAVRLCKWYQVCPVLSNSPYILSMLQSFLYRVAAYPSPSQTSFPHSHRMSQSSQQLPPSRPFYLNNLDMSATQWQ